MPPRRRGQGRASKRKLSAKQTAFVRYYVLTRNGAEAARLAGYKKRSAKQIACQNLTKPYLQQAILTELGARIRQMEISQDRILQEYARLAFFDPRRLFDEQGQLKPVASLDDDVAAAIASLEVQAMQGADGGAAVTKKLRLWDKKGALDSLARHFSLFHDRLQHEHTLGEGLASLLPGAQQSPAAGEDPNATTD